jgi:hypothetical protein
MMTAYICHHNGKYFSPRVLVSFPLPYKRHKLRGQPILFTMMAT